MVNIMEIMKTKAAIASAKYREKDVDAYRKKKAEYAKTPEQKEKRTLYMQHWREKNREKHNETARISHEKTRKSRTKEYRQDECLRYNYGITRKEYLLMLESQGGCAICGRTDSGTEKAFHVDHCHTTHKIRGILCNGCNTRLGWYEKHRNSINEYLDKDYSFNKEVRYKKQLGNGENNGR